MLTAVWILGVLAMLTWSGLCWAVLVLWKALATAPWEDAVRQARDWPWPAPLEAMVGPVWRDWIDLLTPALRTVSDWAGGSLHWLVDAVTLAIWIAWGAGAALLLAVTLAAVGGVVVYRRHERRHAPG